MKKLITILSLAFIAACPTRLLAQNNLENDPAYLGIDNAFDFNAIKPEVNINLPKFLLKDVLGDLDGGKNDPFAGTGLKVSELIQDVKLIRVIVIEGRKNDKTKADAISKGIATLRTDLEKKWTPIAVVAEDRERVGVYAMGDPTGESIAGLALLIHEEGGDTVLANIVGRVSLGKIIKAASAMDKFPKDLLKKLTRAAAGGAEKPAEASADKSKDGSEKSEKSEKPEKAEKSEKTEK